MVADTYPLMDESTSCIRGTDRIRVLSCRHSVRSRFPLCQKGKINILQINSLCNISQFHSYHRSVLYSEPPCSSDNSSLRMFTQLWRGHTQKDEFCGRDINRLITKKCIFEQGVNSNICGKLQQPSYTVERNKNI